MPENYNEAVARAARTITRTDARDPAKYQAAKAAAMAQGQSIIMTDDTAPDRKEDTSGTDVCYLTDKIIVRREAARDPAMYRRLRDEATRTHRQLLTLESLSDIPDAQLQARVDAAIKERDPGALRATADPLSAGQTGHAPVDH